jgi:hypothetical protein
MSGGDRDEAEETKGAIRRWMRRAEEFLRGTAKDDVSGKTGGTDEATRTDPIAARRLGQLLIDDGVLTWDQLTRALNRQRELGARGTWWTLGEVVVEMGYATGDQVQHAITRQVREDHLRSR